MPFSYNFLVAYTAAPNCYAGHDRTGRDAGESSQKQADASRKDHHGRRLDLDSASETEGEGVSGSLMHLRWNGMKNSRL